MKIAIALVPCLLLAACASSPSAPTDPKAGEKDPATADPPKDPGSAATPELPSPAEGRSLLYSRIDTLTMSWQASNAAAGSNARADAAAAEGAVGREVWKAMDTVLGDLESSDNPRWRIAAAKGLGFVSDPRVRPALERSLRAADPRLLSASLVSLARIGSADTADEAVAPLLRHPDPVVRGNAALCLARVFQAQRQQGMKIVADEERRAEIGADLEVLLFEKDDPILRANAAQALGGFGTPDAENALLNRLKDEDAFVRLKSAQALALTGGPRSISPLLDALGREQGENVRVMLALALGAISERQGLQPPHATLGTDAARWRNWLKR